MQDCTLTDPDSAVKFFSLVRLVRTPDQVDVDD